MRVLKNISVESPQTCYSEPGWDALATNPWSDCDRGICCFSPDCSVYGAAHWLFCRLCCSLTVVLLIDCSVNGAAHWLFCVWCCSLTVVLLIDCGAAHWLFCRLCCSLTVLSMVLLIYCSVNGATHWFCKSIFEKLSLIFNFISFRSFFPNVFVLHWIR